MKKIILSVAMIATSLVGFAQVGVGTTDPKGALDVVSTTQGFIMPRATTTVRLAMTVGADQTGMQVFDTTTNSVWFYDGTAWVQSATGSASKFVDGAIATDAVFTAGNVGIGTISPNAPLDINGSVQISRGGGNVAVGSDLWFDGQGLIASESNLFINSDSNANGSGNIYIGSGAETTAAAKHMTILPTGQVGIGTTTPSADNTQLDILKSADNQRGINVVSNTPYTGSNNMGVRILANLTGAQTGANYGAIVNTNIAAAGSTTGGNYGINVDANPTGSVGTSNHGGYFNASPSGTVAASNYSIVANARPSSTIIESNIAVQANSRLSGSANNNYGVNVLSYLPATANLSGSNYGVKISSSPAAGAVIAGDNKALTISINHDASVVGGNSYGIYQDGNAQNYFAGTVGIGTPSPTERLHVIGNILATGTITPDYVFQKYYDGESALKADYSMATLSEIEAFTRANKHLPGVPSAQEVEDKGGILVNRATEINLEKIEELYLHTIEQQKQIELLQAQVKALLESKE